MSGDENLDRFACWGGFWPGVGAEMSTNAGTGASASAGYTYGLPPVPMPGQPMPSAASGRPRPSAAYTYDHRPVKREHGFPPSPSPEPNRTTCAICPDGTACQCPRSNCRCPFCVRGEPGRCFEAAMTSHQTETRDALRREHAHIQQSLQRIETLVTDGQLFLQHTQRQMWMLEGDRKDSEIWRLNARIEALVQENQVFRYSELQGQHNQPRSAIHHPNLPVYASPPVVPPAMHHTGFSDTLPTLNSGDPRFLAQPAGRSYGEAGRSYSEAGRSYREAGRSYSEAGRSYREAGRSYGEAGRSYSEAGIYHSEAGIHHSETGIHHPSPTPVGEYTPTSPEIVYDASGVPGFAHHTARPSSPEYSPPSPTLMMMMNRSFSDSRRSPKRSASAVDDGEPHFRIDRVAPRTSAVQGSISAPAPLQQASLPRIKRRRNISNDYSLVKPEPNEGELRRLTMHAGHTPNRSISSPSATALAATATATASARPSRGDMTPNASSFLRVESDTSMRASAHANKRTKTEVRPEVKVEVKDEVEPEIKTEVKDEVRYEIKAEVEDEVEAELKAEVKDEVEDEIKTEAKDEVEDEIKTEAKDEVEDEIKAEVKDEVKPEETGAAEIDSFYENVMRNSPPLSQRKRFFIIPELTEGYQSRINEAIRRHSRLDFGSYSPPTNPGSSIMDSPASQQALLDAMDDYPLAGPLMITNIPAQDEHFLEVLNGRLGSISQGQDALPKVVQDLNLGAQSDSGEEADGVLITKEPESLLGQSGTGHAGAGEDAPVKIERPIQIEDSDSDGESGPEITLKLRQTSNFGAPFGRM